MESVVWGKEKGDIWNDSYDSRFNNRENVSGINKWESLGIALPCSVHSTSETFLTCALNHKPFLSNPPNSSVFFKEFSNGFSIFLCKIFNTQ